MGTSTQIEGGYSAPIGFIFIFNLIVGTGALTMPKAFGGAGYLLSTIVLVILGFVSYMTVSFMIEAMSSGNAIQILTHNETEDTTNTIPEDVDLSKEGNDEEDTPLLLSSSNSRSASIFEIKHQLEMAHLAQMVFNKVGIILFYISICVYLFGDLTIYAAAAPKSVRDVICTYQPTFNSSFPDDIISGEVPGESDLFPSFENVTVSDNSKCWASSSISRMNAYRICVAGFFLLLGPFVFFNVSKTKYVQIITSVLRWFSFGIMLTLTAIRLAKGEGKGRPKTVNFNGIPNLFGVCVYSFMCHHSLPSLVTPIRQKSRLCVVFVGNYSLILLFYLALSYTEVFSFEVLMDLCTLNFQPSHVNPITNIVFFQYFLALFPAFTLSTNFPIIAVTLRNTMQKLFAPFLARMPSFFGRFVLPLFVLVIPAAISVSTSDVSTLVGITGSYAGVAIQYLIPACLVFYTRRTVRNYLPTEIQYDERFKEKHQSVFRHWIWPAFVIVWSIFVIVIVTYYNLMSYL